MNSTILLIDGDQYIFKACAALERETQWDDHNHVLYSSPDECFDLLNDMVERTFSRFGTREHALCFSQGPNFRKEIDPTYKSARPTRKPMCYHEIRGRCESSWNCVGTDGLEADDVMGILATKPNQQKKIIVSQDKDMKTIPSTVWDGVNLVTYSEAEADYWHLYQTLIGDASDGYPGCPGVGPKGAEKLLKDYWGGYWPAVVEAFVKAKLTEEDALRQARLARILRWSDWDQETRKPKLWTPPN